MKSRSCGPDFTDDTALATDLFKKSQALLFSMEGECKKVGLWFNTKKIEVMSLKIKEEIKITTKDGLSLAVKRTLSTLAPKSAPLRKTFRRRRYKPGEHFTTSRTSGSPCSMPKDHSTVRLRGMDVQTRARGSAGWLVQSHAQDGPQCLGMEG